MSQTCGERILTALLTSPLTASELAAVTESKLRTTRETLTRLRKMRLVRTERKFIYSRTRYECVWERDRTGVGE